MSVQAKYQYIEALFGESFCVDRVKEIEKLIEHGVSFCIHVIPGTGLTQFLRYLVSKDFARFIYIDVFALAELSRSSFFNLILSELKGDPKGKSNQQILELCRKQLVKLCNEEKNRKVVIVINHFDHLLEQFNIVLFSNLQLLKNCHRNVIIICTSVRPIAELMPTILDGSSLSLFAKSVYFRPYQDTELATLYSTLHKDDVKTESVKNWLHLAGGNYQLLELFTKTELKNNALADPFIRMHLQRIISFLTPKEIVTLKKIADGKTIKNVPEYLLRVGLVIKITETYRLFSPLLARYLTVKNNIHLPNKEKRLLQILQKFKGRVVPKEAIFDYVWGENSLEASDWALNSLIYRLRKSPAVQNAGYVIESHKKSGYSLVIG